MRITNLTSLLLGIGFACMVSGASAETPVKEAIVPDVLHVDARKSVNSVHSMQLGLSQAGNRLVSVGESGVVLLSDDNGETWRQAQKVPVSVTLTSVDFLTPEKGWAVGHSGVILRTQDGGETWTLQIDGTIVSRLLLEEANDLPLDDEELRNRAIRNADYFVKDGPDKPFLNIHFVSEQIGYAVGAYGMVVKTRDGGESWQSVTAQIPNVRGMHLYSIDSRDGNVAFAGEQGSLFYKPASMDKFHVVETDYEGSFFGTRLIGSQALLSYGLKGNVWLVDLDTNDNRQIDLHQPITVTAGLFIKGGQIVLGDESGSLFLSQNIENGFKRLGVHAPATVNDMIDAGNNTIVIASVRGNQRIEINAEKGAQ